jgi:hypothetical protein
MATSQELVAALIERGLSQRAIGQAIGRDSSLISQVARGAKPGRNLAPALEALQAQVSGLTPQAAKATARPGAVAKPARRTTKAGALAKVRRPTTVRARWGQSTTMKRQAVRHGAKGMGHALADAQADGRGSVAVTVSFGRSVTVNNTSGGRRGRTGRGGVIDMNLGDPAQVAAEVDARHGGNFSEYVAAQALERGYVSGVADERDAVAHMTAVELRGW